MLGSGSVNASHRGFSGFVIKKWQIGDKIDDHNSGELQYHPEASRGSDESATKTYAELALPAVEAFGGGLLTRSLSTV
jgi:hypothetical protein